MHEKISLVVYLAMNYPIYAKELSLMFGDSVKILKSTIGNGQPFLTCWMCLLRLLYNLATYWSLACINCIWMKVHRWFLNLSGFIQRIVPVPSGYFAEEGIDILAPEFGNVVFLIQSVCDELKALIHQPNG